jgi:hypothetical protein
VYRLCFIKNLVTCTEITVFEVPIIVWWSMTIDSDSVCGQLP